MKTAAAERDIADEINSVRGLRFSGHVYPMKELVMRRSFSVRHLLSRLRACSKNPSNQAIDDQAKLPINPRINEL